MDGSQKEGGNFLSLLQKEGGTQKGGGFPWKRGGCSPGGNYGDKNLQNALNGALDYQRIKKDLQEI